MKSLFTTSITILLILTSIKISVTKNNLCTKELIKINVVSPDLEWDTSSPCFVDVTGFEIDWQDENNGWNITKRRSQLNLHKLNLQQPRLVPILTKEGFKKAKIPQDLYTFILESRVALGSQREKCEFTANTNCELNTFLMLKVREEHIFEKVLNKALIKIAENWSGIALKTSMIYGIRRYLRNAYLAAHVDRLDTHVVSAILQVDQKVDESWPLLILDPSGKTHEIVLKKGEMLLYESAKLAHGRQYNFQGDYFDNVFVHFKPDSDKWFNQSEPNENMRAISKSDLTVN